MAMMRPGVMAPDRVSTTRARVMRRSTGIPCRVRAACITTTPAATSQTIDPGFKNLRIMLALETVFRLAAADSAARF